MTRPEQIRFVRDLSKRVAADIIEQIKAGKILHEWDGHELRCLLAYRHEESASMSKSSMKGKRLKCFKNHIICANL